MSDIHRRTVSLAVSALALLLVAGCPSPDASAPAITPIVPAVTVTESPPSAVDDTPLPAPIPSATPSLPVVRAGSFCAPAGAVAQTSGGVIVTCKAAPNDSRNRWRQ